MIELINQNLRYEDGKLFWRSHTRNSGKEAGHKNKNGYIEIRLTKIDGSHPMIFAHRVIFAIHNGYLPDLVDHIDQNPQNNYPNNLRDASKKLNAINTGMFSSNTSGVKGVSYITATGKWSAQIKVNGKKIHLGTHNTIEDATTARQYAEKLYWDDLRGDESITT